MLWGADFAAVPGIFDVMEIWKRIAREVRGVEIPQCGHLPLEEQPEVVNRELLAFLDDWAGYSLFVAMVPELPGCVTYGSTYEEAVQQAQDAIASVVETRTALGRPIPLPRTFQDTDFRI